MGVRLPRLRSSSHTSAGGVEPTEIVQGAPGAVAGALPPSAATFGAGLGAVAAAGLGVAATAGLGVAVAGGLEGAALASVGGAWDAGGWAAASTPGAVRAALAPSLAQTVTGARFGVAASAGFALSATLAVDAGEAAPVGGGAGGVAPGWGGGGPSRGGGAAGFGGGVVATTGTRAAAGASCGGVRCRSTSEV